MKTPNDDSSVIGSLDFTFTPICDWERPSDGRCVLNAAGVVACRICKTGEYRCKGHWAQLEMAQRDKFMTCDHCGARRPFAHLVRFVPLVPVGG